MHTLHVGQRGVRVTGEHGTWRVVESEVVLGEVIHLLRQEGPRVRHLVVDEAGHALRHGQLPWASAVLQPS